MDASLFSDRLHSLLERADSIAVLTGAGVSAESGVPTFRDPGGLWSRFKPEELANVDAFMRNPDLVWEWYTYRRELIAGVQPNPGHVALAEMQTLIPDFTLVTQNVDNLHQRAGSTDVVELHGNIERSFCMDCRATVDKIDLPASKAVPRCAHCGGLIRPGVVWFGEMLPDAQLRRASDAAARCQLFLSIGTSGEVYPAAQLPGLAREHGAWVVEINPRPSSIAHRMHECIEAPSGVVLPLLVDVFRRSRLSA
ncbi:MAG: NAD-dependent deacylase [Ignavibacteria bacterium]|nr:NAD-dependent deacylase [Ignavibacteria bacterium]